VLEERTIARAVVAP
jgi:hypothetical protein